MPERRAGAARRGHQGPAPLCWVTQGQKRCSGAVHTQHGTRKAAFHSSPLSPPNFSNTPHHADISCTHLKFAPLTLL